MKASVPVFSCSHAEVIGAIWQGMEEEQRQVIYRSIIEGLKELYPGEGTHSYQEVIRASWALGFHYAMMMIEEKLLVSAGSGRVENN